MSNIQVSPDVLSTSDVLSNVLSMLLQQGNLYNITTNSPCHFQKQSSSCSVKKLLLKLMKNSQENTCVGVSFNKVASLQACNFTKKRLQCRVFYFEFCEIFKNTHFEEHLRRTASTSQILQSSK